MLVHPSDRLRAMHCEPHYMIGVCYNFSLLMNVLNEQTMTYST